MDKIQAIALLLGTLGCLLSLFGYLIKFKGKINLIAGINTQNVDKVEDKKGLASFVGGNVLVLGIVFCAGAILMYVKPQYKSSIEPVLLLSVLAVLIIVFSRANKYMRKD